MTQVKARLELEGGNDLPKPQTYREAVRYMAHRLYLRSATYRDQLYAADIAGLDPAMAEFVQAFQRHMARIGVPIYADVGYRSRATAARLYVMGASGSLDNPYASGYACSLAHAVHGRRLPAICWRLFYHVGDEVAGKLGLPVRWFGLSEPWRWQLDTAGLIGDTVTCNGGTDGTEQRRTAESFPRS